MVCMRAVRGFGGGAYVCMFAVCARAQLKVLYTIACITIILHLFLFASPGSLRRSEVVFWLGVDRHTTSVFQGRGKA